MDGDLLVVPAGSLDSDVQMEPQGHIYLEEQSNWDNNLEKVAKFDQLPNQNKM